MNIDNSREFRQNLHERERGDRKNLMVYLSELPDGSLEGTEKMTRKEYARRQWKMRVKMGIEGEGLWFAESPPAVAYRADRGVLQTTQEYGRWIVWEVAGPRWDSLNDMSKGAKKLKQPKKVAKK